MFSAMIFGLKAGLSIGGALVAALLSAYGYDASLAVQRPETANGILLSVSVWASIPFLLGVASLMLYDIRKTTELQIERELGERRASAQH
jgi:Na+/melibiose symporter-like transporter